MKKAKIMLMTIAVLAVVGGALAFKVRAFENPNVFICATTVASPLTPVCYTIPYNTTDDHQGITITGNYFFETLTTSVVGGTTCPYTERVLGHTLYCTSPVTIVYLNK